MATANFTGHEQPKTVENFCSSDLTAGLHGYLIFISVFLKLFFVPNCNSWECSDPNCSSQGVFTSSALQALASLPCDH